MAPAHRGGIGGWIVAGIVAIMLAVAAYFAIVSGGTRYNAPTAPSYAPATAPAAPAATAPGVPAPAPQVTSAPAPPRTYP
jgi:hypothetical protein